MKFDRLFRHHYSGIVKDTVKIRYLMFGIVANEIEETDLMRVVNVSLNRQIPDRQSFIPYFRINNDNIFYNVTSDSNFERLKVTSRILEEL